jgi:hypothetical protein
METIAFVLRLLHAREVLSQRRQHGIRLHRLSTLLACSNCHTKAMCLSPIQAPCDPERPPPLPLHSSQLNKPLTLDVGCLSTALAGATELHQGLLELAATHLQVTTAHIRKDRQSSLFVWSSQPKTYTHHSLHVDKDTGKDRQATSGHRPPPALPPHPTHPPSNQFTLTKPKTTAAHTQALHRQSIRMLAPCTNSHTPCSCQTARRGWGWSA